MIELNDVQFLETDPSIIIADIIRNYENVSGRTLREADPVRLFLLALAYEIIMLRQNAELGFRGNLLYYATGDKLDHLAAMRMLTRKPAEKAVTTLKFTLSAIRPGAILIPIGTRATADNRTYFATTENATIPAGQISVDVPASATVGGVAANGIAPTSINSIVDPIAYVQSVTNTTLTQGGADVESDDLFRARIYEAPAAFSVAGPEEAYKFLAKSASSAIIDVAASSPTAGHVLIQPLMAGGELPTQTIIDLVKDAVSPSDVRPLADFVTVAAPTVTNYALNLTYYIGRNSQGIANQIQNNVNTAIQEWILWQRETLGRDLNPSELTRRIVDAGAKRVTITAPVFTVLAAGAVAVPTSQTVSFGGIEDE